MYKKLQKTYESMLEDANKMFWASLTDLAVSFHPSSPTLLAEDRKIKIFLIFQFKKQGLNFLDISIKTAHSYMCQSIFSVQMCSQKY